MQHIAELITTSARTVIFTGAGMSTESGIPDFRSKDRGLWEKFNPDELANVHALEHNTKEFTDFYRYRLGEITKYKPHDGHQILADWEERGLVSGIITQNVDGFHQDAGSEHVMELHGTFRKFFCHDCRTKYSREAFLNGKVTCSCGGTIRPGIVLFGEALPQDTFQKAEQETEKADLFIVLGSSLTVTPANQFPMLAKENGARLVIVNAEDTPLDRSADLIIQDKKIGELLQELDENL